MATLFAENIAVFETIGQIVVGTILTLIICLILQITYECILGIIGLRRMWICRFRYRDDNGVKVLEKPFPWRKVLTFKSIWNTRLGGYFQLGAMRVPCDPRKPISHENYYGA
jgi:hypothetical protein